MNRRAGAPAFVRAALAARAAELGQPQRPSRPHAWIILDGVDPAPALVLEWRRDDDGWSARTLYVLPGTGDVAEAWLPAARVRPVVA